MAAVVALIAFCPSLASRTLDGARSSRFLSAVFEFVLWCILAFVVYQRHISAVLVFGCDGRTWRGREQDGWRACTCFRR